MFGVQLGTVEQLVRIGLYAAGGAVLGNGVAESAEFQAGVGAVMTAGSFLWWTYREWKLKAKR